MVVPRLGHSTQITKQTSSLGIFYIIWLCFTSLSLDVYYGNSFSTWTWQMCTIFAPIVIQIIFYTLFLTCYVGCLGYLQHCNNAALFPVVSGVAWTIFVVCITGSQTSLDFTDIKYFVLHVLPALVSSVHELFIALEIVIWQSNPVNFGEFGASWLPLFLVSYAMNIDQTEAYKYQVKPPSNWVILIICIIANVRLVFFPIYVK